MLRKNYFKIKILKQKHIHGKKQKRREKEKKNNKNEFNLIRIQEIIILMIKKNR